MKGSSNTGLIITALSSFIGGFAVGLLLSPKSGRENREWVQSNARDLATKAELQGREVLLKGEEQAQKVTENIRKTLKDNVPDLYEATEIINMNED